MTQGKRCRTLLTGDKMTANGDELGGRLPLREPSTLTEQQRALYDLIFAKSVPWGNKAGFKTATADGRLIGPFNAFLLNPKISETLLAFDSAVKSQSSLSERVREVIIVAVGGVWAAKYELYTHSILARNAGISPEAIKSLASGELPKDLAEEEVLAARVARDMSVNHRIDDALFAQAKKTFGEQGLYEIAALIGEFHLTCTILNLFDIPAAVADV
jgi:4-carboxymuconolactone decarboxylase